MDIITKNMQKSSVIQNKSVILSLVILTINANYALLKNKTTRFAKITLSANIDYWTHVIISLRQC